MFTYIVFLLFTYISSWKIKLLNETNLIFQKGLFYPINLYIELDANQSQYYKEITILTLSNSSLVTSEPSYEIDTFKNLNYTIYIGAPCDTKALIHLINFTTSNPSTFHFDFNLTITLNESLPLPNISVSLLNEKIASGTFSMYFIYSPNLVNVDPIHFTFTNATEQYSSIENKTMRPFSDITPRNFRGFYNASNTTSPNQSYTIEMNNTCYKLTTKNISFSIGPYKPKDVSSYKTSIIKQFKNFKRKKSSIHFELVIPISPTIVNCIAIANAGTFPSDDDIRNGYLTEQYTPYEKYYNYVIKGNQQQINVSFWEISTFRSYRIKCIIDDAVVNETLRTSAIITIGEFYNADIYVNTNPSPSMPFNTQCITFKFDGSLGIEEFKPKVIHFCENFLYRRNRKPSSSNGCPKCVERSIPKHVVNESGICIVSEENCETDYTGFINYDALDLKSDLGDTDRIKYILNISNISNFVRSDVEEDTFSDKDDYKKYIFGYPMFNGTLGNNSVEIMFKNNYTLYDFDCFVLDFDVNIPHNNLTREDFIGHSQEVYLPRRRGQNIKNESLTLMFANTTYDNNIYPIIVKCYPLAYVEYRINESPALLLNSLLRTNKTINEDTIVPKKACINKNELLMKECINRKYYDIREFAYYHKESLSMLEDISTLKENFVQLDYKYQKIKVIVEEELLRLTYSKVDESNLEGYLQQHIKITDLLKCCNCNKFPSYNICQEWKMGMISNVTKSIINIVKPDNLTEFMNQYIKLFGNKTDESYYKKLVLLYIAMYGLTTSPESINVNEVEIIYKLHEMMFQSFYTFTNNLTETDTKHKENILYIMLSSYFNLIEISKYQFDYSNKEIIIDIKNPDFYSNETISKIYRIINEVNRMIISQISASSLSILYNKNIIYLYKPTTYQNEIIYESLSGYSFTIRLNPLRLIEMTKQSSNYIGLTIFNIYPFITENDDATIGKFVSIKTFSEKEVINITTIVPKDERPSITFETSYDQGIPMMQKYIKCIYIDKDFNGKVDLDKIETEIMESNGHKVKCFFGRSGDVTLQRGYEVSNHREWFVIGIVVLTVIVCIFVLFFIAKNKANKAMKKKRVNLLDSGYKTIDSNEGSEEEDEEETPSGEVRKVEKKDKLTEEINKVKSYNIEDL